MYDRRVREALSPTVAAPGKLKSRKIFLKIVSPIRGKGLGQTVGLVWKIASFSRLKNLKALVHLGRRGEKWGRMVTNGTDGDIPPNAGR